MALASCRDERLRGIHGCHGGRAKPSGELRRKCAGSAADIEHALTIDHVCQNRKPRGERNGVAAHEAVIRVGGDREAHAGNLRQAARALNASGALRLRLDKALPATRVPREANTAPVDRS